jgi:hypothetical protein
MKKILLVIFALQFILISCEKEDRNDNHCPVVDAKSVSAKVISAFETRYPATMVEVWFNKDNKGYCAYFKKNGSGIMIHFQNDGTFIREEVQDQQGNHQGSDDDDEGCECEVED